MPIKIYERIKPFPVHRKKNTKMFQTQNVPQINVDNAEHIVTDIKFNRLDRYIFEFLDFANPFIIKYPRIGNVIVNTCEKIIKSYSRFSQSIIKKS